MSKTLLRVAVATLLALASLVALSPSSQAATGRVITLSPGSDDGRALSSALSSLRPGDQLRLNPGVYNIGQIHPKLAAGTAAHPILLTGTSLADRPLLRGSIFIESASYWLIQDLRVQGTIADRTEFYIAGGTNWTVRYSEFFGASDTGSFANVAVANSGGAVPHHWAFVDNCVHDGGRGTAPGHGVDMDHNMYVSASGNAPGLIARNVFYNATNGYNIKIGEGAGSVPSASTVHVMFNTMYNARRQMLILGRASGEVVAYNVMSHSTRPKLPVGVAFLNLVQNPTAALAHNWYYQVSAKWSIDPVGGTPFVHDNGDNGVHSGAPGAGASGNPVLGNAAVAKAYGPRASNALTPTVP